MHRLSASPSTSGARGGCAARRLTLLRCERRAPAVGLSLLNVGLERCRGVEQICSKRRQTQCVEPTCIAAASRVSTSTRKAHAHVQTMKCDMTQHVLGLIQRGGSLVSVRRVISWSQVEATSTHNSSEIPERALSCGVFCAASRMETCAPVAP